MNTLTTLLVPILSDNYAYLIRDDATGLVGIVDPGEVQGVDHAIAQLGGKLDWILITHHHDDHIAGVDALREKYAAKVVGAAADAQRLPLLDESVRPESGWRFGEQAVAIIDTPGHTVGHIAYYFSAAQSVFVGDTLFTLGCGRMFEGTALQMWGALCALAALPPETRVYAGHEYTLANARFAATIEKENTALAARIAEVEQLRSRGEPTLPTTIGIEKATNPFLRAKEESVKAAVGLAGADDAAVFAEIRRRKDVA